VKSRIHTKSRCSTNTPDEVPLDPYRSWAVNNGYSIQVFESSDYPGGKLPYAQAIYEYMRQNGDARFIIVGHSAGADASILAIEKAGYPSSIQSVVLLDPTLSATLPDGSTDIKRYADQIASHGIAIFLGVGSTEPQIQIAGAIRREYPSYAHPRMAVDKGVFADAQQALGWR
jgi:pimeloyl-ACP methyl ester carboxylesterase